MRLPHKWPGRVTVLVALVQLRISDYGECNELAKWYGTMSAAQKKIHYVWFRDSYNNINT